MNDETLGQQLTNYKKIKKNNRQRKHNVLLKKNS